MSKQPIHPAIKQRLGYAVDEADDAVYDDWKARLRRVCKPCWELKYCPYGPLVEQSPILPGERAGQVQHMEYLSSCIASGTVGSVVELSDEMRENYERWLDDEQVLISQVLHSWKQVERFNAVEKIADKDERLEMLLGKELPPIQEYRVSFELIELKTYLESDFPAEIWEKIQSEVAVRKKEIEKSLDDGKIDNRKPIEPSRREMFEAIVEGFDPDDYPESIPTIFSDGECSIFGHICPVFFAAEIATESSIERRIGRKHMRFETMMRIVRRDDYRCQHCMNKLRDDEVEFDHIIPVSKGGSSEEHNMRLTCFDCNRDKSDDYAP